MKRLPLVLLAVLASCAPQSENHSDSETGFWASTLPSGSGSKEKAIHYSPELTATVATEHEKYLADPMVFVPLADGGVTEKETAVVGSRVARFYPLSIEATLKKAASVKLSTEEIPGGYRIEKDWSQPELESLPKGDEIPFGTILPILATIDGPVYDYFAFQGNFNQFFRTRFDGHEGFVFGADLYGLGRSRTDNQVASDLYVSSGKPSSFHATFGTSELRPEVKTRLEKAKLAFENVVYKKDYYLSSDYPDDMISNYRDLYDWSNRNYKTVFVTTDLAAHAQHLAFDRILQHEEEVFFAPRLLTLVKSLLAEVVEWNRKHTSADPWTSQLAVEYLQVAEASLRLAPTRVESDESETRVTYQEVDSAAVLSEYSQRVRKDLDLMEKAGGFDDSGVLSKPGNDPYSEDFSQYKPRGHYTKNGILKAYFRAMMWFGRVNFLMSQDAAGTKLEPLTEAMVPTALLFADLISKNQELYDHWSSLFDPITALIGLSDDLSWNEVVPLWRGEKVEDVAVWTANKENLLSFLHKAHERLRPPAISGNSVFEGPSDGAELNPPMGWRLFGQRFTWDSYVHENVSPPRLLSRDMVRGLDIMKAFGSKTADALLAASDYPKMDGLKERLDSVAKTFSNKTGEDWNKTFYDQTLFTVRAQALFEPGVGFYFTESPSWGLKAMISSHGTWAELRHDTILYVKQVYGERAGDGDFDATFRTEPVPKPVHYIEPNLPFWQGLSNAANGLQETLSKFDLLDEEGSTALSGLVNLYQRAAGIVELEVADKPVERKDLDWIPTFAGELVPLVMVYNKSGYVENDDLLKMALIADVYTNAELGKVLEVGVGLPLRMYVPLNDGQGGKRIAVGYTFSYYEFQVGLDQRMTDEEWKAQTYPDSSKVTDKLPFWEQGLVLARPQS